MDGLSDHDCHDALDQWQAHIERLRILVERSCEFTPPAFIKSLEGITPELRQAAMAVVIRAQMLN